MRRPLWAILLLISGVFIGGVLDYLVRQREAALAGPSLDLNWLVVLACFLLSGAFGGIIATFQWEDIKKLMEPGQTSWRSNRNLENIFAAAGISALGGAGGAVAAMFLMIVDGKLRGNPPGGLTLIRDIDVLTYISTGVVAGFVGFQIIKKVALNLLAQKVDEVKAATEENKALLEHTLKKLALSNAVIRGLSALDQKPGAPVVKAAITDLRKALDDFPADRAANITLGRVLDELQADPSGAIDVLKVGLAAMEREGTTRHVDSATVCWNIAAYYLSIAKLAEPNNAAEAGKLKDQTISFLRKAIKLDPSVAGEAAADPDFKDLKLT
jgi:hypothetical protein